MLICEKQLGIQLQEKFLVVFDTYLLAKRWRCWFWIEFIVCPVRILYVDMSLRYSQSSLAKYDYFSFLRAKSSFIHFLSRCSKILIPSLLELFDLSLNFTYFQRFVNFIASHSICTFDILIILHLIGFFHRLSHLILSALQESFLLFWRAIDVTISKIRRHYHRQTEKIFRDSW